MSFIGKLIYRLYFRSRNQRAIEKKFSGKANYLRMLAAEEEMRKYAMDELVIPGDFGPDGKIRLNFLTGDKFLHQSLFCTYSFFKYLTPEQSAGFSVNYYSDGTLTTETVSVLRSRFPNIRIIGSDETQAVLREVLPGSSFPYLNKKLVSMPLFKKMVYPHLKQSGLSIFLDSDMLFVSKPVEFLDWLDSQDDQKKGAFCIQDVRRSYGYTDAEILQVWPPSVKNNINSGMYAFYSEQFDLRFVEDMIRKFENSFGSQYFLEQLITAIMLEQNQHLFVAPRSEYIVLPDREQVAAQLGTLHHFVNESKALYFFEGWRKQVEGL